MFMTGWLVHNSVIFGLCQLPKQSGDVIETCVAAESISFVEFALGNQPSNVAKSR